MELAKRPITQYTVCTLKHQHEKMSLAEVCELISVRISEWERRLQGAPHLKVV
jgi:DNA-binding transcriptional regulator WhiA